MQVPNDGFAPSKNNEGIKALRFATQHLIKSYGEFDVSNTWSTMKQPAYPEV
jgi:hypothetical protein